MSDIPLYHAHPQILAIETTVRDARPGRVLLAASPFYPGGGGQLADRGILRWSGGETAIAGIEQIEGEAWLCLADEGALADGAVEACVDGDFRQSMRELHTATHILNALVFAEFSGALVTGAQLGADGTARMDFDLPGADNDRLRDLEAPLSDIIHQDLAIKTSLVPLADALAHPGLIRSKAVAPPPTRDGIIRIVEVEGLDRQACGSTHLVSTGASRPIRIIKIENKGRHNRRIRIALTP